MAWVAYYAVWMAVLTFAVTVAVRVVASAASPWRVYRTAAAGAIACLVGLVPTAFDLGHPAQVMVPVMWVVAACAARDRRFAVAGALVGLQLAVVAFGPNWKIQAISLLFMGWGFYMLHGSLQVFASELSVEARATALKEALAWQVQKAMKRAKINKVEMARRMNTSRAALDRLLDPGNASVTLQTLCRAARAIGRDLRIELV